MKWLVLLFGISVAADLFAADISPTSVVLEPVLELDVGEPVTFNGFVRSQHDIELPATVDGELMWVKAEGEPVLKGETLARVDDQQLQLQRQEQQLMADRARITVTYLEGEVARLSQLQQANLAAKTQLAELVSRRDLAKNDYEVARARVEQLDETLARTRIRSPIDGVIVERLLEGGEFARRGDSVVRILSPERLEIQVLVPVAYLNRLQREATIRVKVSDVVFEAPLRAVVQASDRRSQSFGLIVDVPLEAARNIVAGQFADATIAVSDHRRSLFVPRDAVVLRSEGSFVFRVDAANVAQRVDVTLGNGQGDMVSVSGNLSEGDRVAVRGVEQLQDGQEVLPTS